MNERKMPNKVSFSERISLEASRWTWPKCEKGRRNFGVYLDASLDNLKEMIFQGQLTWKDLKRISSLSTVPFFKLWENCPVQRVEFLSIEFSLSNMTDWLTGRLTDLPLVWNVSGLELSGEFVFKLRVMLVFSNWKTNYFRKHLKNKMS